MVLNAIDEESCRLGHTSAFIKLFRSHVTAIALILSQPEIAPDGGTEEQQRTNFSVQ